MIFLLETEAGPLEREMKAEMDEETHRISGTLRRLGPVPSLGQERGPHTWQPEQQPSQTPAAFEGICQGLPCLAVRPHVSGSARGFVGRFRGVGARDDGSRAP